MPPLRFVRSSRSSLDVEEQCRREQELELERGKQLRLSQSIFQAVCITMKLLTRRHRGAGATPILALFLLALSRRGRAQVPFEDGCTNTVVGVKESDSLVGFQAPIGVAVLGDGSVAVTSQNALYVSQFDGSSIVVMGNAAVAGDVGDGGSGADALLSSPQGLAYVSWLDFLLIADAGNHRVRALDLATDVVYPFAGTGKPGSTGDGGSPLDATLDTPRSISMLQSLNHVVIADFAAACVRRMRVSDNVIETVVGTCYSSKPQNASNAVGSVMGALTPLSGAAYAVSYDPTTGLLYVMDRECVWEVNLATGKRRSFFAFSAYPKLVGEVSDLVVREDPANALTPPGWLLLVVSVGDDYNIIWGLNRAGAQSVYSGGPNSRSLTGNGGPAPNATTDEVVFITYDATRGNVFFTSRSFVCVRRVAPDNIITTPIVGAIAPVAAFSTGTGDLGYTVAISGPRGVRAARNGDIYFAEGIGARIGVLRNNGTIQFVAGSGENGYSGDGGPALAAALTFPYDIGLYPTPQPGDGDGLEAFIVTGNACLRLVTRGTINAIVGVCTLDPVGTGGDGGPAINATFASTSSVAIDSASNMYIADYLGHVLRKVNASTGIITTFAGSGVPVGPDAVWSYDASWEGGPATAVALSGPISVTLSPDFMTLYCGDVYLNFVFAVDTRTGVYTRVLGIPWDTSAVVLLPPVSPTLGVGPTGTPGPALNTTWGVAAVSQSIIGVSIDSSGTGLLVVSSFDNVVVRVDFATGTATIVMGTGATSSTGDLGPPLSATLFTPRLVTTTRGGDVFVSTSGSNTIRQVSLGREPNCPPGFTCTCGLRPLPCTDPSRNCMRGSLVPSTTAPGFVSTSEMRFGNTVYVGQAVCPIGSFCSGGVALPCPSGTYGTSARQASASSCTPCGVDTYLPPPGQVLLPGAAVPCIPCPIKSSTFGLSGQAFCTWPEAGTNTSIDCPNGQFAFGGSYGNPCVAESGGVVTLVNSVVTLETPVTLFLIEVGTSGGLQLRVALGIFALFFVPSLVGALMYLSIKCGCARKHNKLGDDVIFPVLRTFDQMGDWTVGSSELGDPVHWESTAFGGACSAAALGVIFALMSAIILQFVGPDNKLRDTFTLPSRGPVVVSIMDTDLTVLPTPVPALPFLTSGLVISVGVLGSACARADVDLGAGLTTGAFEYQVTETEANLFVHKFTCTDCVFAQLSSLRVVFPGTCGAVGVLTAAVGARGEVTATGFQSNQPPDDQFLATMGITIQPAITVVVDETNPSRVIEQRGYIFSASNAVQAFVPKQPASVVLTIKLPASNSFSGVRFTEKFAVLDLIYQLLATLAFGSIFTFG